VTRELGTITTANDKGFAFLKPDNPAIPNVFAHYREFRNSSLAEPKVGGRYSFTVKRGDRGPVAIELEAA
jgi:cold shock CspA family protein